MHHNKSFVKLPEGFGRLQALAELDLGTCSIEEKGLSSDFGNLSGLRTLRLQYNKLATLPETFRDLGALVSLDMHHCPNLIDVQALPWNLEHMDIGDCPNLTDIPFLGKMSLLKCLRLCNCTRLTQLQGLESLPSLVELNVAGCTMLENVSGLNHNRALEQCYLSGSKISMKYDNDWLKKEPATQVVSYYEDTIAFAHNGMAQKVTSKQWANELCMETILTNPEECIAVIFSFVAHDQGWSDYPYDQGRYNGWCSMEARIVRNNEDVYISSLFRLRHADRRDQMYFCTLRRLHPFVHALQHGDKIRVETHPSNKSVSESLDDEVKVKLATLQLADNPKLMTPTFAAIDPDAIKKIYCHDQQMAYTMPRSLRDLHNLVTLGIYHCLNLNDVQALPQSLQYLDICDCPQLMSIPSLDNLSLLRSLTLCKCTKLTQIQGLDSLTSLVEVNLTGCTMLQNAPGLNNNNTLEKCYLSGSKICMPYDSNWLKKQPAEQVVSYYDSNLGFANNGMAVKVKSENGCELCMETTVTEHKECIAVIFSFVAHDQGWSEYPHEHGRYNSISSMEAHIIRDNEEIQTCELFRLRHADEKDQVYLCTLRKLHPFVNALQHGDKICVYAQSRYKGWTITVEEGAMCVLYAIPGDHGEICAVVNGGNEASSNLSSKEVKAKLTRLQLVDNASHQMNTVQQRIFCVDSVPVCFIT
ncbi:unnamed protein product [Sphagnum troendelagicum]|uniref:Uncharacterized protein n=1 Tax=Sphagnum troendelagicum TaxID=128251 RepID=A0ABP0TA59_9BRYO